MSTDGGGLSRREHDEMRDLVLAATHRIRPARSHRAEFVAAGVALLLVGVVTGGVFTAAIRQGDPTRPVSSDDSRPVLRPNDAVAFGMGWPDRDIYLVDEGSAPRRIVGSDEDDVDQVCPAFSSDGGRLAYGEAGGNQDDGYREAALVLTDVTAAGALSDPETIELDDMYRPPCPIWSPDGRWVAFGAGGEDRTLFQPAVEQVWLVDTQSGDLRRLTDLSATDIDWAPDSSELFLASDGVLAYSVATGDTRQVGDMPDAVAVAVSPHDGSLAVERLRGIEAPSQLWVMDSDGSDERMLVQTYSEMHGVGPVWSPDGARLAFQRTCSGWFTSEGKRGICRENHDVVVVSVRDGDPLGPLGTQTVIAPPRTSNADVPSTWFPWSVTWSPDGTTLLYLAWDGEEAYRPLPETESQGERMGLIAVRVDGSSAPATLYEGFNLGVYAGAPWNTFQSWQSR